MNRNTYRVVRKSVSVPGILSAVVLQRYAEHGYTTFSPYAINLVAHDLRVRKPHTLTLAFAKDTLSARDAVDRVLVSHYRPGTKRGGLLLKLVAQMTDMAEEMRKTKRQPAMSSLKERVSFPALLWPCIEIRWREAGYDNLSSYVTGLVRYDLMILGPYLFDAADCRPEILTALDMETRAQFEVGGMTRTYLDYRIEDNAGRTLTDEERERAKETMAYRLLESACK